jgi:hypothetical protein
MSITSEFAASNVREQLARLRETAADRPAHAELLEALIEHFESGDAADTAPGRDRFPSVSAKVAEVLRDDVDRLFWYQEQPNGRQCYIDYPAYRDKAARAASRRQESRNNPLRIDLSTPKRRS